MRDYGGDLRSMKSTLSTLDADDEALKIIDVNKANVESENVPQKSLKTAKKPVETPSKASKKCYQDDHPPKAKKRKLTGRRL